MSRPSAIAAAGRTVSPVPARAARAVRAGLTLLALLPALAGPVAALAGTCPGARPDDPADLSRRAAQALAAVPPETAVAVACLTAAQALGDPGAGVVLGHMAAAGLDGPADPTRAAAAFSRAAEAGSPQGLLAMGLAYARGQGLPADPYWAYWFLGRAARTGGLTEAETATAAAAAAQAAASLTPAQRAHLEANIAGAAPP